MRPAVLIPVHGFAPYLAEALDSVLAQAPSVVVVVDDASPVPVRLHPDHAPHVRLLRRDACGGPAAARQEGLALLEPAVELVALCDADDAWEPGKLDAQLAELERHPQAAVCFGRATIVGPDDRPTGERWPEPAAGLHEAAAFGAQLYGENPIPMSSAVVRRAWLDHVGGFQGRPPVDDWELWLRIAAAGGDFACAAGARVRYRRHPGGLTADVAALAAAQLEMHETYRRLAAPGAHEAAVAADRRALAAGRRRARIGGRDPYRRRR